NIWMVKDLDGYTYGFEKVETATNFTLKSSGRLVYNEEGLKTQVFQTSGPIETAFYLSFVESPKKNRVIFTYEEEVFQTPINLDERVFYSNSPGLYYYYRYGQSTAPTKIQLDRK